MANVMWIKLMIDIFGHPKIKFLRAMPEGDKIVLMWIMLLTMAGRCNAMGDIFLTESIPYSSSMLAAELGFQEPTVELALKMMEQLKMISIDQGLLTVVGWEEYQNVEGMEKIKEQNRLRQRRYRERHALESNVTVTFDNALDEESRFVDSDIENKYQTIFQMYNSICRSLRQAKMLTNKRKEKLIIGLQNNTIEDYEIVFKKAEESSYLRGKNKNGWIATFDWVIDPANMVKIFEGTYDNRSNESDVCGAKHSLDQSRPLYCI